MTTKRWHLYPPQQKLCAELSSALKTNPFIAQVLINRGCVSVEQASAFLQPKLAQLSDPFDIPDLQKGARRVLQAKNAGEKVMIYGDYDVDGVSGTTVLLETLRHLGMKAEYYIPFRYGEGYSLNLEAIEKIKKEGARLIITVDCGIGSKKEVELANSLGMEVVITDHHNIPNELPPAHALINPKMIAGQHPSKNLAGVGVAFKFAWGLLREAGIKDSVFLTELLDLVALGTIADVVPLTGENRILVANGLKHLDQRKRLGLKHLMETASVKNKVTLRDVNFGLAPRLNAAGRLEHASLSVNLLTSKDPAHAKNAATELSRINVRRQEIGKKINEEVSAMISADSSHEQKIILHSGCDWHPGVIGITASQIADRFYRPVVLIGINEGMGRGSARSIEGFNVYELLNENRELFNDFGGHAAAAGFEIDPEKIPELKKRLLEQIALKLTDETISPVIKIDAELPPIEITLALIKEIEALGPFGEGNPAPLFMSPGLRVVSWRQVGAGGAHLKIKLSDGKVSLDVIGFGKGALADNLSYEKCYDIAYNLETNIWDGFEVAQLNLVDIKEVSS